MLKIKIEVDTDPPPGFDTETRFLLQPIPFSVRAFSLPDMFAGKMHAVLCRGWKGRVKGRDWYDLVWYVANHPQLHLKHLEQRMIQSGHSEKDGTLDTGKAIYHCGDSCGKAGCGPGKKRGGTLRERSRDADRMVPRFLP